MPGMVILIVRACGERIGTIVVAISFADYYETRRLKSEHQRATPAG